MKLSKRTRNGIIRYLHIQGDAIKRAEQARLAAIDYRKSLTADFAKAGFKVGQRVRIIVGGVSSKATIETFVSIGSEYEPRLLVVWKGKRLLVSPEEPRRVEVPKIDRVLRALSYSTSANGSLSGSVRLSKKQARSLKAKFERGYHSDTAEDNLSPTPTKLPPFNKKNVDNVSRGMLGRIGKVLVERDRQVQAYAHLKEHAAKRGVVIKGVSPVRPLTKAKLRKMLVIVKRVAKHTQAITGSRLISADILIAQINKRIKEVGRGR